MARSLRRLQGHPVTAAAVGFWQRHGGLPFFGLLCLLLGFLVLSPAAHRWIFYLAFFGFLYQAGAQPLAAMARHSRVVQLVALFALYNLATLLWQADPGWEQGLRLLKAAASVVGITLFLIWAVQRCRAEGIADILIIFAGAAVLVALGTLVVRLWLGDLGSQRLAGLGHARNPITAAVVYGFALMVVLAFRDLLRRRIGTAATLLATAVLAAFVVLTFSRGPLIGLAGGIFALCCLERRWWFAAAVVAGGAVTLSLLLSGALDSLEMVLRSDNSRLAIWGEAWQRWLEKPIFGWGAAEQARFAATEGFEGWKSTHNVYLGTAFYGGLVGLALLLLIPLAALRAAATSPLSGGDLGRFAAATLVFGLTLSLFEFHSFLIAVNPEWLVFWLPLGLLAGLAASSKAG